MVYNYQDPKYKNATKWNIGDEVWVVTGVWSFADDDSGRNARTDKLVVRRVENGKYVSGEIKVTKNDFERAINNKKSDFK